MLISKEFLYNISKLPEPVQKDDVDLIANSIESMYTFDESVKNVIKEGMVDFLKGQFIYENQVKNMAKLFIVATDGLYQSFMKYCKNKEQECKKFQKDIESIKTLNIDLSIEYHNIQNLDKPLPATVFQDIFDVRLERLYDKLSAVADKNLSIDDTVYALNEIYERNKDPQEKEKFFSKAREMMCTNKSGAIQEQYLSIINKRYDSGVVGGTISNDRYMSDFLYLVNGEIDVDLASCRKHHNSISSNINRIVPNLKHLRSKDTFVAFSNMCPEVYYALNQVLESELLIVSYVLSNIFITGYGTYLNTFKMKVDQSYAIVMAIEK